MLTPVIILGHHLDSFTDHHVILRHHILVKSIDFLEERLCVLHRLRHHAAVETASFEVSRVMRVPIVH